MFRKTLTIFSLIGLLLSMGMWGVSYWGIDYYGHSYEFEISAGGLSLIHTPAEGGAINGRWSWGRFRLDSLKRTRWLPSADLADWPAGYWDVYLPLWSPSFVFTVLICGLYRTFVRSVLTAESFRFSIRKLLTLTSLIGLMSTLGLWALSYGGFYYGPPSSLLQQGPRLDGDTMIFLRMKNDFIEQRVGLFSGRLIWYKNGPKIPIASVVPVFSGSPDPTTTASAWYAMGFQGFKTHWRPVLNSQFTSVAIPFWIPALIFTSGLTATRPIHNYRRRKRKKLGLCLKCGYDLRGSTDTCPECGTGFEHGVG